VAPRKKRKKSKEFVKAEGVRRDVMTVEQRSACMARIRGKDTGPERFVLSLFDDIGITPESHARDLPGRPDFVLRELRIAVFVDGDFWHGWRFPAWRHKLAPFWEKKIAGNRTRDGRNFARLRRSGWKVIRIWEHQIVRQPESVRQRITRILAMADPRPAQNIVYSQGRAWLYPPILI